MVWSPEGYTRPTTFQQQKLQKEFYAITEFPILIELYNESDQVLIFPDYSFNMHNYCYDDVELKWRETIEKAHTWIELGGELPQVINIPANLSRYDPLVSNDYMVIREEFITWNCIHPRLLFYGESDNGIFHGAYIDLTIEE